MRNLKEIDVNYLIGVLNSNFGIKIQEQKGFCCGQAVASAIDEINGLQPVYNDLDFFDVTSLQSTKNDTQIGTLNVGIEASSQSYSELTKSMELFAKYRIEFVTRKGLINTVFVRNTRDMLKSTTNRDTRFEAIILNGFDINSTRVGLIRDPFHPSGFSLIYDKHYEEFVKNRQLRIISAYSPAHTIIRLEKKYKELSSVSCDFDLQYEAITAIMKSSYISDLVKGGFVAARFGSGYLAKLPMSGAWNDWFDLQQVKSSQNGGIDIWKLASKREVDPIIDKYVKSQGHKIVMEGCRQLQAFISDEDGSRSFLEFTSGQFQIESNEYEIISF